MIVSRSSKVYLLGALFFLLSSLHARPIQWLDSALNYEFAYSRDSTRLSLKRIKPDSLSRDLLFQPEVFFWIKDIELDKDSFLVVEKKSRTVLDVVSAETVLEIEKGGNLKCLGTIYQQVCFADSQAVIRFVRGRKQFFNYAAIGPKLYEGMSLFEANGVDPLYAQLLLLIESPNDGHGVSSAGAVGNFQLMPRVARRYGLRVNRYRDDRTNFRKSAVAASKLFRRYCIPSARRTAESIGLEVDESSLWFKLLALHVYNAGGGNVKKAARSLENVKNGNDLIKQLWHTKYGAFGNSSQNYSQLCLASYRAYTNYFSKIKEINTTEDDI